MLSDSVYTALFRGFLPSSLYDVLDGLLRTSPYGLFFHAFWLNMSNYSSQMSKKMDSKWLPLTASPVLGWAPSSHRWCFQRLDND